MARIWTPQAQLCPNCPVRKITRSCATRFALHGLHPLHSAKLSLSKLTTAVRTYFGFAAMVAAGPGGGKSGAETLAALVAAVAETPTAEAAEGGRDSPG